MDESARGRKPSQRRAVKRKNTKRAAGEDRSEEARRALAAMLGMAGNPDWDEIDARQREDEARFGLASNADITLAFLDGNDSDRRTDD